MTLHLGYVAASSTLYIPFHTFDSNGASITLTGLAVTDIEIYKNGSVTQRASDAGYTLLDTDGIDFDGLTGIHGFSIDLADNTDAGFYAAGSFYWVVVSAVTVDTRTVSFVAATFFIGPIAANATQILGTAISTPATAGILDVNVKNIDNDAASASGTVTFPNATLASTTNITAGTVTTATNVTTVNGLAADVITAASIANGAIDAATFAAGAIDAAAIATDAITAAKIAADAIGSSELAAGAVAEIQSGLATAAAVTTVSQQVATLISSSIIENGTIGSTGNDTTHVHLPSMTWGDDELNDHLLVIYDDSAAEAHARWIADWVNSSGLATVATLPFTPQNATDLFYLLTVRRDVLGTGTGLTAVPWNAAWDAEVQSEVQDALDATIADSIPADGTRPSVSQALLMVTRFLWEKVVSGTTVTVKKEDGATSSFTATLDSSTDPTSITRAS